MSDILWRDTSGDVVMWLMNGGTIASSVFVGESSHHLGPIGGPAATSTAMARSGHSPGVTPAAMVAIWQMKRRDDHRQMCLLRLSHHLVNRRERETSTADGMGDILWRVTTTGEVGILADEWRDDRIKCVCCDCPHHLVNRRK